MLRRRVLHPVVARGTSLRSHVLLLLLVLRHELRVPTVLRGRKVIVARERLLRVDLRPTVLGIGLIAAAVAPEEDLQDHQSTEDQEHSMHKLSLVAGHLETSCLEAPKLASRLLLLLVHPSVHLFSLLPNELTLLLEEVLKVLLGLIRVEALSLLL